MNIDNLKDRNEEHKEDLNSIRLVFLVTNGPHSSSKY